MATAWEWIIERWDGEPTNAFAEIVDVDHADTLEDAIAMSRCDRDSLLAAGIAQDSEGDWVTLCARSAAFDRDGENPDFEYHYLYEDPDIAGVPRRLRRELQVARKGMR